MRLIDCFTELIAFTAFSMKEAEKEQFDLGLFKNRIESLLEKSLELKEAGSFTEEDYDMAKFAVCAWIDESVLCSQWKEKERWEHEQLQRTFYDTTNAGEEFFERMERIPPDNRQLLEVYGACLYLGFSGRYYAVRSRLELEQAYKMIEEKVMGGVENPFASEENKFFASGYLNPKEKARKKYLRLGALPMVVGYSVIAAALVFGLYLYMNNFLADMVAVFFK